MVVTIDCELPSPYIGGGVWPPNICNGIPTIILAIQAITEFICEDLAPGTGNNSFRLVMGGTPSADFNDNFDSGTPAQYALVAEGNNLWVTANLGVTWDILSLVSFVVGEAADFIDPDNPLPAEINGLFPETDPPVDALMFNSYNGLFYYTKNSGGIWTQVAVANVENNIRIVAAGTSEAAFNATFTSGTPSTYAIVIEGNNIWKTSNAGGVWTLTRINTFQVGNAGDFADPTAPTPSEINALFPDDSPASNALMYNTSDTNFYQTQNSGTSWTILKNSNFRRVPATTPEGDFNDYFDGDVPDDYAIVFEGQNIWWTDDRGANWDILRINSFQVGNAGDFVDPDNPTAAELRALFPQGVTPANALVYSTHNNSFYETQDAGVGWAEVPFVMRTGDQMSGTLDIAVNETDSGSPVFALSAASTHTITSDNDNYPTGVLAQSVFDVDAFDTSLGPVAVDAEVVLITDALGEGDYAVGVRSGVTKIGGGNINDAIAFQALSPTLASTALNAYGVKVENQSGATNNYGVHTGTGLNRFGDQVSIVGNQDVVQLLLTADNAQTSPIIEVDDSASTAMFYVLADGEINILPRDTVGNGGGSTVSITTPNRTAMATTTEEHGLYFDISSTRQWTAGAITNQREIMIERPTYAFTSASTITNAATVYIKNAPAAGTNATITNAYALWIDDGAVRLDGNLGLNGQQPVAQSTGWAVTNPNTRKTFDTTTITLPQLAEVVGTLVDYMKSRGDLGA